MAVAFLAKSIYQLSTTEMPIDRLEADIVLRRICGFSRIPDWATFSRAFAELSHTDFVDNHPPVLPFGPSWLLHGISSPLLWHTRKLFDACVSESLSCR